MYKVYSLLIDLSELDELDKKLWLFSHNKWAPLSFYDKDHGEKSGIPVLTWVKKRLKQANIDCEDIRVSLLCYPRVFGYVFNPLSVYFCHQRNGALVAILYEVSNTFNESHTYLLELSNTDQLEIRQRCAKKLYVSPFIELDTEYQFRVLPPGKRVRISIRQEDKSGVFLVATFSAKRIPLSDKKIFNCLIRIPFMTIKVICGIHFEALVLWLKGLPIIKHQQIDPPIQNSNYPAKKLNN